MLFRSYDSAEVVSMRTHCPPDTKARSMTYDVMAEPPLSAGAVHESETCPLLATAVNATGAPGTARGVTLTVEAVPRPPAVMGTTRMTDWTPFTSPVTIVFVPVTVRSVPNVCPPSFETAMP